MAEIYVRDRADKRQFDCGAVVTDVLYVPD